MIMFYEFMGYLNHVDLLMAHVHVLKKQPYCLMCTSVFLQVIIIIIFIIIIIIIIVIIIIDKYLYRANSSVAIAYTKL